MVALDKSFLEEEGRLGHVAQRRPVKSRPSAFSSEPELVREEHKEAHDLFWEEAEYAEAYRPMEGSDGDF